ncbi:hypothetical protein D3C87_1491270 [compost metagenome]
MRLGPGGGVGQDRGQHDGLGNRDAELLDERVVEELVVRDPPEGIVDDVRALDHRVLEVGLVDLDLVRDAIDEDVVAGLLTHLGGVDLGELGDDLALALLVDGLDEGVGEGVLPADQDTNLLGVLLGHCVISSS